MNRPGWLPFRPMKFRRKFGTAKEAHAHFDRVANVWEEYERRKAEIAATASDSTDYDRRIRELTDELGI